MATEHTEDLPKPSVEDDVTEETSVDESKVADDSSSGMWYFFLFFCLGDADCDGILLTVMSIADPVGSRKREREVSLEPPTPTVSVSK